ncbi:hypothetical protein DSO57_1037375 [Entomophthora muscae]|uniref:Uncharacterized protein n=1 Tax=Entomophthora muscae TaxID=34485 RepID=A0ACC2RPV7_9FUNG|nr:hypothetical protein DSO57_1037375 [Entomophthora muscae]
MASFKLLVNVWEILSCSFPKNARLTFKKLGGNKAGFFSKSNGRRASQSNHSRVNIPSLEPIEINEPPTKKQPKPHQPSRYSWIKSPLHPNDSSFPNSPDVSSTRDEAPEDDNWEEDFNAWESDVNGRKVVYEDFTAIDWNYDFSAERLRKRRLSTEDGIKGQLRQLYDSSQTWFIILLLGVGCGLIAGCIDIVSEWLADIRLGYCHGAFYNTKSFCCWGYEDDGICSEWVNWEQLAYDSPHAKYLVGYFAFIFWGALFSWGGAFLVYTFAPYASSSGLPEIKTILGGFIIRGFLGKWTLLIKSLGLCLSVASGLCLGKEAALVHIACCCGNLFLRLFPKYRFNEAKKREIFSAAASAGIAVAFGAPIGGVLYSLEEVSYYFPYKTMWRSFFSAMAAAVTLKWMNPFRTFKLVLFQVTYSANWHGFEMMFFLLLGVLGGIFGSMFIRFNVRLTAYRLNSWVSLYPVLQVVGLALITAAISYPNMFMKFDAADLLSTLFKECDGVADGSLCNPDSELNIILELLVAGACKFVLAILTFGLEIPGGFYMPTMMVGACFGRVLGILVSMWQRKFPLLFLFSACPQGKCISPATYAMVGAAAMLGGVTRLTVSLVVIMFELTGALAYVLPIMMAVMTSKWVGDAFGKGGLTDGLIRLYGYPFLDQKEDYAFSYTASSTMTRVEDLVTIPASGVSVGCIRNLLNYTTFKGFPVVRSSTDRMLVGYVYRSELKAALDQGCQQPDISETSPCIFDLQDSQALETIEGTSFLDMRYWTDHVSHAAASRSHARLH